MARQSKKTKTQVTSEPVVTADSTVTPDSVILPDSISIADTGTVSDAVSVLETATDPVATLKPTVNYTMVSKAMMGYVKVITGKETPTPVGANNLQQAVLNAIKRTLSTSSAKETHTIFTEINKIVLDNKDGVYGLKSMFSFDAMWKRQDDRDAYNTFFTLVHMSVTKDKGKARLNKSVVRNSLATLGDVVVTKIMRFYL